MNTTEHTVQHLQLKKPNHLQILSKEYNSDQTGWIEMLKGLNVLTAK